MYVCLRQLNYVMDSEIAFVPNSPGSEVTLSKVGRLPSVHQAQIDMPFAQPLAGGNHKGHHVQMANCYCRLTPRLFT